MHITDWATVKALQVRAPGYSKEDLAALEPLFWTSKLFSTVWDPGNRQNIWNNLQQVEGLIPTIESFFKDFKYLWPPAKIMRQLFGKMKHTVYKEMYKIFLDQKETSLYDIGYSNWDSEFIVQDSDKTSHIRTGDLTN